MHGIFGRKSTKYTGIYGVHLRFWPNLHICRVAAHVTIILHVIFFLIEKAILYLTRVRKL